MYTNYECANRKMNEYPFGFRGTKVFKTDIWEIENGYELAVELPGYKKEDIKLDYDKGYLTITAKKEDTEREYLRKEIYNGEASRTFYLGDKIDPEKISAKLDLGILTITALNVTEKESPKRKIIVQ